MNNVFLKAALALLTAVWSIGNAQAESVKRATYTTDNGHLVEVSFPVLPASENHPVEFRTDSFAGPSLLAGGQPLPLAPDGDADAYRGENDTLAYALRYEADDRGGPALTVSFTNRAGRELHAPQLSLLLGINTDMDAYPHWHHVFFPTLLRCEKTHFWGYLMSPLGRVLTLTSPDAVASYRLLYNNDRSLHSFGHGHRIRSVVLDLVNPAPLPSRHPALHNLKKGETRTWRIYLDEAASLAQLPDVVARRTGAAVASADLYSPAAGEASRLTFCAPSAPRIRVQLPDGRQKTLKAERTDDGRYALTYRPTEEGIHTFTATCGKKVSELKLTCRTEPYSAYLKAARRAALRYPQKATSHTESWYGFFPAYAARELFPEPAIDRSVDSLFAAVYPLMYDSVTNRPLWQANRIQNHALMAALHAARYRATGDTAHLQAAADLADYILFKQGDDGAYRNGKTHYTSVIYVAKALMEVMAEERPLAEAGDATWAHRYRKHYYSVRLAIDELARNLDNIQTEGEMTFEDGMISCSYTQLSAFALLHPEGSPERERYTEAAIRLADMHRCLSQLVVPDSRMHGGSLRYWEAQYDILTFPDMMNSPHGWSAWRIYGLRNLYLLTGRSEYLQQMVNAIGTCIQLIEPRTAQLNWAFICDPYIRGAVFEPDPEKPGKGHYVYKAFGECYMPMISDWYRAEPGKNVTGYWGYDGGCCDNDVHEIFKCLNEILVTSAYVHFHADGSLTAVNCSARKTADGRAEVTLAEDCIATLYVGTDAGVHPAAVKAGQKTLIVDPSGNL